MSECGPKFKSKRGFIWVATGSAVGLGNLWRFPYLVNQCGGAAFIFVYILCLIVFGIVLAVTDIAIGRKTGKTVIRAFLDISKKYRWVGYISVLIPLIISGYYCVIGGWIFKYLTIYATGSSDILNNDYYESFISCSMDGIFNSPIFWFILFALIATIVMSFNINKGLEKVSMIAMPLLLCILVVIALFVLTIPGIGEGLSYYFIPDINKINAKTFIGAFGQMFYSLSIAMGVLVTFGSYMDKNEDIEKSAFILGGIDCFVSVITGMIIVPLVHIYNETVISGSGLMFYVLPRVFAQMEFGHIIGLLFFLLASIAALTSVFSMVEVGMSIFTEIFGIKREISAFLNLFVIFLIGISPCLGYGPLSFVYFEGSYILEMMDFFANTLLLPFSAIGTCMCVVHALKIENLVKEVKSSGPFRLERIYSPMIKYVAPFFISLIFIFGVIQNFFPSVII